MRRQWDRAERRSKVELEAPRPHHLGVNDFKRRGAETTEVSERNRAKNLRLALIRRAAERKRR